MREIYSCLAQEFEGCHLPVVANTGQEDAAIPKSEVYSRSYLAIDDRLERPPMLTMSPDHLNDLFIEFTYTLDIDREVFSVDDAAHFNLSKIPRGEQCIKYVDVDEGRRILLPDTPKEIIANVEWKPDLGGTPQTLPGDYHVKIVTPITSIDSPGAPRRHLLLAAFLGVLSAYRELLDRYILSWKPDDFSSREIALALLSLAAGEVAFECSRVLDRNKKDEGYFLIPDAKLQPQQQKLLPTFLNEIHVPGVESGSAPKETTYWFGNVLVHLMSRLDLVDVEEAAVAEVAKIGLS